MKAFSLAASAAARLSAFAAASAAFAAIRTPLIALACSMNSADIRNVGDALARALAHERAEGQPGLAPEVAAALDATARGGRVFELDRDDADAPGRAPGLRAQFERELAAATRRAYPHATLRFAHSLEEAVELWRWQLREQAAAAARRAAERAAERAAAAAARGAKGPSWRARPALVFAAIVSCGRSRFLALRAQNDGAAKHAAHFEQVRAAQAAAAAAAQEGEFVDAAIERIRDVCAGDNKGSTAIARQAAVPAARLDHQDAHVRVFAKAVSERASGRTGADDDVVKLLGAAHG